MRSDRLISDLLLLLVVSHTQVCFFIPQVSVRWWPYTNHCEIIKQWHKLEKKIKTVTRRCTKLDMHINEPFAYNYITWTFYFCIRSKGISSVKITVLKIDKIVNFGSVCFNRLSFNTTVRTINVLLQSFQFNSIPKIAWIDKQRCHNERENWWVSTA